MQICKNRNILPLHTPFSAVTTSVIIPTYNRKSLISYTLDSLAAVHHPGVQLEVILVDDGSTDGLPEFVREKYPQVQVLRNKGKGAGAGRNTGLQAATGKYIMYLDSDDIVGEGYFTEKIAYLEKHPAVSAVYGAYDRFTSDAEFSEGAITFQHKYPGVTEAGNAHTHMVHYAGGNFLPPHTIIWRRDFLLSIKGHDETLRINQDVELVFRALLNGLELVAVEDGKRVYARDHALEYRVGKAQNDAEKWKQMLALRKSVWASLQMSDLNTEDVRRAMSSFCFAQWKKLRHQHVDIAPEFLALSHIVYWPVPVKGGVGIRLLAALFGPVVATNLKYTILRRD